MLLGPVEILIVLGLFGAAFLEPATLPLLAVAAATPRRTTTKVKFGEVVYEIAISNFGDDLGSPTVEVAVVRGGDGNFVLSQAEVELMEAVGFFEHSYERGLPPQRQHMKVVGEIVKRRMEEIKRTYDRRVIQ